MSVLDQWFQAGSSAAAMPVWLAGALAALAVFAGVTAFRRAGQPGQSGLAWRATLVLAAAGFAWALAVALSGPDRSVARRSLEARAVDLTSRVLTPGSPLGCLEAVANPTVEEACEKALFANAETVAAALAYVDARISLLAESLELSPGDHNGFGTLERWRRSLEGDRFGLVAHVLRTRGCSADHCEELKLLRDPQRVLVNLRERSFEAQIVLYSPAWRTGGPSRAAPEAPAPAAVPPPAVASAPAVSTTGAAAPAIDYPTAASIPAISIMNAEPPLSAAEAQALGTPPPAQKPAAAAPQQPAQQPRRQSARDSAPPPPPPGTLASPHAPAAPPVQIAPPAQSNIPRWGSGN